MDFYHSWLYLNFIDTKWFLWILVGAIMGLNLIGPVLIWMIFNSKPKKTKDKISK
jgi:hypothetical protein